MEQCKVQEISKQLQEVVGTSHLLNDPFELEKYGHDETEDLKKTPDWVVRPASEIEVSEVLKIASHHKIPVTPRGAGTGLSGGAVPILGGIILSLERMNKILEIDEKNLVARVEPGVITAVLQEAVEARNLFYPPDPASRESCTLGGNLAEDAGGPRAVKYGVTSAYVRGLRAVLPSGEAIACGGKTLKDVAGYNLLQLLLSSEGTLAVITEAFLRLIPLPPFRRTLLAPFNDLDKAAKAVPSIINQGIVPSALEFIERSALKAVEAMKEIHVPYPDAAAHLLIEIDGFHASLLDQEAERCAECLAGQGAEDVFIAESRARQDELWRARRAMGEAVKKHPLYRELDTAVPRFHIPDLVRATHRICSRHGVELICYGHAGDGNLHMNILAGPLSKEEWLQRIDLVAQEVFKEVKRLGGTITGEHGIGWTMRPYLKKAVGKKNVALMKSIKDVFDPHGILNPGKIFLTEREDL
ncbi:MAG: FAD-binding protein [Planctomycetes bacterium]|nr:FAD-binding protein [Planctomycetota bacterium]